MIQYDNSVPFRIIFQLSGSILPSCLPIGFSCFTIGTILAVLRQVEKHKSSDERSYYFSKNDWLEHPFVLLVAAPVLGFLLVVRANMAFFRWQEGLDDVVTMLSKWSDAFVALNAFFCGKTGTKEQMHEILMFRLRISHWFSLMSCLCFATLRNKGQLGPIEEVPIKELFDALEQDDWPRKSFADNRLASDRMSKRRCYGMQFASTSSGSASSLDLERRAMSDPIPARRVSRPYRVNKSNTSSNSLPPVTSLRPGMKTHSMPPELPSGRRQSHNQVRSSYLGPFSLASMSTANRAFVPSLPKLMDDIDLPVLAAPTEEEVRLLEQSSDKPNTIAMWIIQGTILMVRQKLLDIPPPIVSRIYQELSNGMLGFKMAHRLAEVPFPFPFAQLVSVLLTAFYICLPFYIDLFTQNVVCTPVLSFILPTVYCALNSIAIELEEPFGTDINDVDIEDRHEEFLWLMVDVLRSPKEGPNLRSHEGELQIIRRLLRYSDEMPVADELLQFQEEVSAGDALCQHNSITSDASWLEDERATFRIGGGIDLGVVNVALADADQANGTDILDENANARVVPPLVPLVGFQGSSGEPVGTVDPQRGFET